MRILPIATLGAMFSVLALAACLDGEGYAAEVVYRDGGTSRADVWGDFSTLEACRSAAQARYNALAQQGRADSWACLKKNGSGGYASRHR